MNPSPLRYPGGKTILSNFLAELIRANNIRNGIYIEPYAGGAGAALNLLFGKHVKRIVLNDIDSFVFSFWRSILKQTDQFTQKVHKAQITISEWKRQRDTYRNQTYKNLLDLAFAGFFLNRCNRSGIILDGGPIGGYKQTGKWKLNARFNKIELIRRIEKIALYKSHISIFKEDALTFLRRTCSKIDHNKTIIYLDPPYFKKGSRLYLNHYQVEDHNALARFLKSQHSLKWILSYDNVPEVRRLYQNENHIEYYLNYSASSVKRGCEVLFYSKNIKIPSKIYNFLPT